MEKFNYLVLEVESRGDVKGMNIIKSNLEIKDFCEELYRKGVESFGLDDEELESYLEEFGGVCEVEEYFYEVNLGEDFGYNVYRVS